MNWKIWFKSWMALHVQLATAMISGHVVGSSSVLVEEINVSSSSEDVSDYSIGVDGDSNDESRAEGDIEMVEVISSEDEEPPALRIASTPRADTDTLRAAQFGLSLAAMKRMIALRVPCVAFNIMWYIAHCSDFNQFGRDLDFLHVFGGGGACHRAAQQRNLHSVIFEVRRDRRNDVLTTDGFICLLSYVLRLKPLCGHHWDIPCSTWVWLAMSKTQRSLWQPMGPQKPTCRVFNANLMTNRSALCFRIGMGNENPFLLEQPNSSLMMHAPRMQETGTLAGPEMRLVRTWLGAFGADTPKLTKLYSPSTWPVPLQRTLTWEQRRALSPEIAEAGAKTASVNFVRKLAGKSHVTGNPRGLKRSQAYPSAYGVAAVESLLAWKSRRTLNHSSSWEIVSTANVGFDQVSVDPWQDAALPAIASAIGVPIDRLAV